MLASTPYLTLSYRENPFISGITVHVQTSTDLKTWIDNATPADQPQPTGAMDATTGDPIMQAQVPVTGSSQFIRLQVTSP